MDGLRIVVRRCLAGDQQAMLQLVEQFQGQIFGLCYRMLGHRQDAEDITQEVFVRALRGLAGWDAQREFKPWLMAIAGNRCRTLLASKKRRLQTTPLDQQPLGGRWPDEAAVGLAEELDLALAQLRAEYRQAFLLFHDQQLSYLEIAAVMDCPVGTVKTWVYRARQELAAHLSRREVVHG